MINELAIIKAISNTTRLSILEWLKNPSQHFPEAVEYNTLEKGVCCGLIQKRTGLCQSTISNYLTQLEQCGLLIATRDKQWTYYRRNETVIDEFLDQLKQQL